VRPRFDRPIVRQEDPVHPLLRLAGLSLVIPAAVSASCGGKAAARPPLSQVNPGSSLQFTPSEVDKARNANGCGLTSPPPYSAADDYSMNIIGDKNTAPPFTAIFFTATPNADIGTPYALPLSPQVTIQNPGQTDITQDAQSAEGALSFEFGSGSRVGEIDSTPLSAVTVTVLAFPHEDGDSFTVRFVLAFSDGQTLDETFSNTMVSNVSFDCGAG
jgi:hypothetical protein